MLIHYDGEWVSGDTGRPLLLLLTDAKAVFDPTTALSITVRLRELRSNRLVEGTGSTAPWPKPVDGKPATAVSYGWLDGGADMVGEVQVECRLQYTSGPLTFPTEKPAVIFFRAPE